MDIFMVGNDFDYFDLTFLDDKSLDSKSNNIIPL